MSEISIRTVGPKSAKRAVQKAFKHNRPLFLWGPPGIGKSEIIHQPPLSADPTGRWRPAGSPPPACQRSACAYQAQRQQRHPAPR